MPSARSCPPCAYLEQVVEILLYALDGSGLAAGQERGEHRHQRQSQERHPPPSILELVPNSNPTAGLGIHDLDVGREIGVSDLDPVPAWREIDIAQRGRDAAHLAVDVDLAPRRDGETERRRYGDLCHRRGRFLVLCRRGSRPRQSRAWAWPECAKPGRAAQSWSERSRFRGAGRRLARSSRFLSRNRFSYRSGSRRRRDPLRG